VIVMDISMPELDGLEATRRIRAELPQCCVLILTVHAQERYLFPVLKAGAAGYVLKSTVDTELLDAIRTVARGGAFLYPSATKLLLEDYLGQLQRGGSPDAYETLSERERESAQAAGAGLHCGAGGRQAGAQPQDRGDLPRPHHGETQPHQPRRPDPIRPGAGAIGGVHVRRRRFFARHSDNNVGQNAATDPHRMYFLLAIRLCVGKCSNNAASAEQSMTD
jgi:hypothetical protein